MSFCFPKVEKLNYSAIYESIILKFGGHLPLMIIYHQKNLRNNIKVKVHKEYCDEIFFLQFLSYLLYDHHEIWWASPILDYLQVLLKRLFTPTTRGSSRTTSRWRLTKNIVVEFFFLCKTIIQEKVKLLAYLWINHPEFLITIFIILAIVIIALPISGLLCFEQF